MVILAAELVCAALPWQEERGDAHPPLQHNLGEGETTRTLDAQPPLSALLFLPVRLSFFLPPTPRKKKKKIEADHILESVSASPAESKSASW